MMISQVAKEMELIPITDERGRSVEPNNDKQGFYCVAYTKRGCHL